jgi:hypothetical protein
MAAYIRDDGVTDGVIRSLGCLDAVDWSLFRRQPGTGDAGRFQWRGCETLGDAGLIDSVP